MTFIAVVKNYFQAFESGCQVGLLEVALRRLMAVGSGSRVTKEQAIGIRLNALMAIAYYRNET